MAIDAEKKISLLSRFFSNKKGKYVFLVCDDERVVRQVQFQLYLQLVLNKNKILHHLALSEDNPSVYSQVKDSQERELYDGLIVSNLNLLIYRYAEKIINELNVSRDALAEFGIPIVFIVNNENLKKITSRASDLYQMREMSDFHFESGNIREWDNAKSRVASSFEYTLPELKLELLEEQVDALSEKKQLSPDEISAYVIPLLSLYLDKFEIDKAENLYKSHIHGDIDKTGSFKDFETIGRYYREQNSYKEALIYFNKALGVASDDIYVAKTYLNLGIVYRTMVDFINSEKYYLESLQLYVDNDFKSGIAVCYQQLGLLSEDKGNLDQAIQYHKKSLKYISNNIMKAVAYKMLGIIYDEKGDSGKAEKYYKKASEIKV